MTTTVMFPHSNSFGEPDPYGRMSGLPSGYGSFFSTFNPTGAAEPTNHDIHASQHQNSGQPPVHEWSSSPLSTVQPQNTQHTLASQPHTNTDPTPTASINPVAFSNPTFTPANRPTGYYDSTSTVSPSQSHFETSNSSSPVSFPIPSRRDSLYHKVGGSLYPQEDETPSRRPSTTTTATTPPTNTTATTTTGTTRRRRNSEYVEPGSARAIYLEKNRRAASKCRSKQKHEQEQLVERSRQYERRNRMLKAEVDLLQAEVRALKDLLGQHAHCPDQRIAQYLQMEASRLASSQKFPREYRASF